MLALGVFFILLTMSDTETMDLASRLGRVEGKLDAVLTQLTTANTDSKEAREDHDKRLKKLETWRVFSMAWLSGATATGAFLAAVVYKLLPFLK